MRATLAVLACAVLAGCGGGAFSAPSSGPQDPPAEGGAAQVPGDAADAQAAPQEAAVGTPAPDAGAPEAAPPGCSPGQVAWTATRTCQGSSATDTATGASVYVSCDDAGAPHCANVETCQINGWTAGEVHCGGEVSPCGPPECP